MKALCVCVLLLFASILLVAISLWLLNKSSHVAIKDVHVACFVHEKFGMFLMIFLTILISYKN